MFSEDSVHNLSTSQHNILQYGTSLRRLETVLLMLLAIVYINMYSRDLCKIN